MSGPGGSFAARELIRSAIARLVRDAGGQIAPRTLYGRTAASDFTTDPEPEPLAAIRAARQLASALRSREHSYIRWAREDGRTWAEIGEALGCEARDGRSVAELAFRHVAPGDSEYDRTTAWSCPSCRQPVTDHGPEPGTHPADMERGHADGCARLAAASAEYERQWEDG